MHLEDKSLDIEYADQMRVHPYGTALYNPQPHSIFHPGMAAYFDRTGNWNPIIDLSEPYSTSTSTLKPPATLPPLAKPENQTWGPKLGYKPHSHQISLEAGISQALLAATGAPISLTSHFRFESEGSSGAWVVANAGALLAERADLRKCALWVVTSTWAAEEAAVNCWRDCRKGVDVGFEVGVVEVGEVVPKGSWVDSGAAAGWLKGKGNEESGGRRVVFFGGLRFKYRPVIGNKANKFRGDATEKETVAASLQTDDGMEYDLSCEEVLEDKNLCPKENTSGSGDSEDYDDPEDEAEDDSDDDW
ncbi:hypothetical protein N7508_004077 [Penicillium antarcticum]|uniref:uncharacterized protein n=1 Tax=Penicillium antarcticum TaxID=416450 RepID=UPI00238CF085|nr:uncharacterized protein N7508_004077 [Penicillium antarcticum]KAJ5308698.1 hypothetical protein N7508_004077 [Penicillium antarcticum]